MTGRLERRGTSTRRPSNGYPLARLADLTTIFSGGTPSKRRADYWSGAIPWVSSKDVKRLFLTDVADHISQEALTEGSRLVPAGAVFVVVRGMALAKDIPVAMAMVPMAFNQDIKALVPGNAVAPEFLLFSLKAHKDRLMREVGTAAHGTRRMAGSAIEDFTIPLPPLAEQRATAAALRSMYEAVEVQEKIVAGLRELKAATMGKLFREGLRGERRKQTEIGEIPKSWEVVPLVKLLRERLRNGHSAVASGDGTGVPTLTLTAVTRREFTKANLKMTKADPERVADLWLLDGDILVERANTKEMVGLAAMYRGPSDFGIFPDLMIRVRVQEDRIQPRFVAEWLLAEWCRTYFQNRCRGAATSMPKIDHGVVEGVLVPVPPEPEQTEGVGLITSLDRASNTATQKLANVRTLFSSTLHLLMIGQVRMPVSKEA